MKVNSSTVAFPQRTSAAWMLFLFAVSAASAQSVSGLAPQPFLSVVVDHPILVTGSGDDRTTSSAMHVECTEFPAKASLVYAWKQVQDVLSPIAAKMDQGMRVTFDATNKADVVATFPNWGVYEIKVTVTDPESHKSAWRHAWINVWDSHSHILKNGVPDPLFAAPAITPPKSIQTLSPDPGPFQHPRLYATDSDWAEINKRSSEQIIPGLGLKELRKNIAAGLETPSGRFAQFTESLATYADSNYTGQPPDLTMGIPSETKNGKPDWSKAYNNLIDYYGLLRDASLDEWLSVNPHLAKEESPPSEKERARKLAKVLAAVCHLHLANCWDRQTGAFKTDYPLFILGLDKFNATSGPPPEYFQNVQNIALAYDFLYSRLTKEEAYEVRNFLFAVSVGRSTGARYFPQVENGITLQHGVDRGLQQNGDFMNIDEGKVLSALVIDGEDSGVDPAVVKTFTVLPRPSDFDTSTQCTPYDWVQPATTDTGGKQPVSKPYPEGGNWPFSRKVEVDNLQRAVWWSEDWYMSPWGFAENRMAYYGFSSAGLWPVSVAYARHGAFNNFVAGSYYTTVIHHLYSYYLGESAAKSEHFSSNTFLYDHHDGGWSRAQHALILKYMYPDDPAVDCVYTPYAPQIESRILEPLLTTLFGMDPGIHGQPTSIEAAAKEKCLPLTKVDPQVGLVVARSDWSDDAAMVYFDDGWTHGGHMHAEKNSFAFFALGRAWAISPGYSYVISNEQSGVMIQDPAWAKDPITQGYVGESPSLPPEGSPYPHSFPTPPGHLIEVSESSDHSFTLMAGDAKAAYDFSYNQNGEGRPAVTCPWSRQEFLYPGFLQEFMTRVNNPLTIGYLTTPHTNIGWDNLISRDYNPVRYAFRSILFARGKHPYMIIVDDISKDESPRNYRWTMNCLFAFGAPDGRFIDAKGQAAATSLIMDSGATSKECTLLHVIDQGKQEGLPRLLVRDVSEFPIQDQRAMTLSTQNCGTEYNHPVPTNRLFIDRDNVFDPKYTLLFYPYRTGEELPVTTWSSTTNTLQIGLPDGTVDSFVFDRTNPDHRTRIQYKRSNQ